HRAGVLRDREDAGATEAGLRPGPRHELRLGRGGRLAGRDVREGALGAQVGQFVVADLGEVRGLVRLEGVAEGAVLVVGDVLRLDLDVRVLLVPQVDDLVHARNGVPVLEGDLALRGLAGGRGRVVRRTGRGTPGEYDDACGRGCGGEAGARGCASHVFRS